MADLHDVKGADDRIGRPQGEHLTGILIVEKVEDNALGSHCQTCDNEVPITTEQGMMCETVTATFPFVQTAQNQEHTTNDSRSDGVCGLPSVVLRILRPCQAHQERYKAGEQEEVADLHESVNVWSRFENIVGPTQSSTLSFCINVVLIAIRIGGLYRKTKPKAAIPFMMTYAYTTISLWSQKSTGSHSQPGDTSSATVYDEKGGGSEAGSTISGHTYAIHWVVRASHAHSQKGWKT